MKGGYHSVINNNFLLFTSESSFRHKKYYLLFFSYAFVLHYYQHLLVSEGSCKSVFLNFIHIIRFYDEEILLRFFVIHVKKL